MIPDSLSFTNCDEIVDLAAQHRLPSAFSFAEFAVAGGLLAYGPNSADLSRWAATCVDKMLKGAKPADLPVEQPTKFDFVINLANAQTLGLTIPGLVLQQPKRHSRSRLMKKSPTPTGDLEWAATVGPASVEASPVRGRRNPQATMVAFVDLEERVPATHPLRIIKHLADEALATLSD